MPTREQHVMHLLSVLQHAIARIGPRRTPTGERLGLTAMQVAVLGVVHGQENPTMSDVAADQFVHRPAATRVVNELVERKFIVRVPDPSDRRVVRLRLTPQGRRSVDRVHAEVAALLARVLDHMSAAEQQALLLGLASFIRAVSAVEAELKADKQQTNA